MSTKPYGFWLWLYCIYGTDSPNLHMRLFVYIKCDDFVNFEVLLKPSKHARIRNVASSSVA